VKFRTWIQLVPLSISVSLFAGVGDPQIRTDHQWYPGELAFSTFERLFATQAELYRTVTGRTVSSDQDKALAAWLWRNTHYAHGEEGVQDWWGMGFRKGGDVRSREYWTGLFAHGYGLCGTTHSQWTAEFEHLLGHGRGRGVGAHRHNTFEVFLTGGTYGDGKWVLLDHDLSTVVFDRDGKSLLSADEVAKDWKRLTSRRFIPEKQNGWLVCGLHPNDGASFQSYNVAEYLSGYAGPPPMNDLRRGETLRRYVEPGLEDGKTFVFWSRNYNAGEIPGPARAIAWVNQPDNMYRSKNGAGRRTGQTRYGNAVYTYQPDFNSGDYREGVFDEEAGHVTFWFRTPYIIGATPPNNNAWGVYEPGCSNGLVLVGKADCPVSVSTDCGQSWSEAAPFRSGLDLTDLVKGHNQYLIKFDTSPATLARSGLTIRTVCQVNSSIVPRLKPNGTKLTFLTSGKGVISAGPTLPQARGYLVDGDFKTPTLTLEIAPPKGGIPVAVYAAAHVASGNPPSSEIVYQLDVSIDGGRTWNSMVDDWRIPHRGVEPSDFWSQSFCYGSTELKAEASQKVRVRFRNTGGRKILRAEAHLVYSRPSMDSTRVTCSWEDAGRAKSFTTVFSAADGRPASKQIPTGDSVVTKWIEFQPTSGK